MTSQPQPVSSARMPSRIGRLVVDGEHRRPASGVAAPRGASRRDDARRHAARRGDLDREDRAAAGLGVQRDRVIEDAWRCARRSTGRARGRAPPWRPGRGAGTRGTRSSASSPGCRARYPRPRGRRCPAPARADQHAALRRVLDARSRSRFCNRRRSRRRSERTASEDGTKVEVEPFSRGDRARTRAAAGGTSRRCGSSTIAASSRPCRGARCRAAR